MTQAIFTRTITIAALALTLAAALAADGTWNTTAGGNWNTGGNWTGGVPNGVGEHADLSALALTADTTVTLDVNASVGNLDIADTNALYSYAITGANTLTFDDSDATSRVNVTQGTNNSIGTAVSLGDTETEINVATGTQLTISGDMSGANRIEKWGGGTLRLTGNNTFAGGVYTAGSGDQGTIDIAAASALWDGALRIGYGSKVALRNSTGSALTVPNNITNGGGSQFLYVDGDNVELSGSIQFNNGQGHIQALGDTYVNVSGTINCTGVYLESTGTIDITGTNSGTIVNLGSGTHVRMGTAFGAAQTTMNANTHLSAIGGPQTFTNSLRLGGYGTTNFYFDGTNDVTFTDTVVNAIGGSNDAGLLHIADGIAVTFSGVFDGVRGTSANHYDKYGDGTLVLSGANTYNYRTYVQAGVLRAADGQGLPTNSYLRLAGGVLETNGTFNRALANLPASTSDGTSQFQWSSSGGFSANGGALSVDVNGGAADDLTWGGTANFLGNGHTLILGSESADSPVTFIDNIDLGSSTRTVHVPDNASSAADMAIIAGNLTGTGGLSKTGDGTLELQGTSTYAGATTVTAGTLRVAGGSSITSDVTAAGGTTVGGAGAITGGLALADGATLEPGDSPGTLTVVGNVVLNNTTILSYELGGPAGPNDLVAITGDLTLDGILNITDIGGFQKNASYTLFSYTGILLDHGLVLGTVPEFGDGATLLSGDGMVRLVTVPEPASALLLVLVGLAGLRRRRS